MYKNRLLQQTDSQYCIIKIHVQTHKTEINTRLDSEEEKKIYSNKMIDCKFKKK
jgi:hypothetical protein